MPPTYRALHEKVLRAHYTALQWKTAHIHSLLLPDPGPYGWKWDTEMQLYDVGMTKLPPASKSIIDLTVFDCKTGCNTSMLKCLKNGGLKSTEMFICENCENVESEDLINLDVHDSEEHEKHEQ